MISSYSGPATRRQSKPGTQQHFTTTLSWAVLCTPTPQPRIKAKWLQHIPALLPALKWRVLLLSSAERDVSSQLLKQRWKTTCKRKGCCPHELKSLSSAPHFSKHPKLAPSSYHTADFGSLTLAQVMPWGHNVLFSFHKSYSNLNPQESTSPKSCNKAQHKLPQIQKGNDFQQPRTATPAFILHPRCLLPLSIGN